MSSLSTVALSAIFISAALTTWVAGVRLAKAPRGRRLPRSGRPNVCDRRNL